MRTNYRALAIILGTVMGFFLLGGESSGPLCAKDKGSQVSSDDPTLRLYNLLDSKFSGKLDDFYVLADVVNDAQNPGQPQQHVISADYSKDRAFGKLNIHIRTVAQLTPAQLKTYTPKQIFAFAEDDTAKFTKTDPGTFGKLGDVYFQQTSGGGALGAATITSDVQADYDRYVTQYLMPALEKKAAGGSGS